MDDTLHLNFSGRTSTLPCHFRYESSQCTFKSQKELLALLVRFGTFSGRFAGIQLHDSCLDAVGSLKTFKPFCHFVDV